MKPKKQSKSDDQPGDIYITKSLIKLPTKCADKTLILNLKTTEKAIKNLVQ